MTFDVGAETVNVLNEAPYERRPMTRQHRYELHSVDVHDDVALALFGVRSRRRQWLAFAVACPDRDGRWEVVWSGRHTGASQQRLEPRALVPTGLGTETRYLHGVMTTGYSDWRYAIASVAIGVEQVRIDDHSVDVPPSGWVATVWPAKQHPTLELLDGDERVLGRYRPRTRPPWGMREFRRVLHRGWL